MYQEQFVQGKEDDEFVKEIGQNAAAQLIERFHPLFKKYYTIIKTGVFNWNDSESKDFVSNFINDRSLLYALRRKKQRGEFKKAIYTAFNFVKETYGKTEDEEIMADLQMLFLTIAKRYKRMGKNFCAYVANSYKYEVARHIKKAFQNPLNVKYKISEFNANTLQNDAHETYEDKYYEDETGIPSMDWINGYCNDAFQSLSVLERKILVKYYLENLNDKQIASELGLHLNTINAKRRKCVETLCNYYNIDPKLLKRNRKSGKNAILSIIK